MRPKDGGSLERRAALEQICRKFNVAILYVFGSRADEVWEWNKFSA